jgi:hypothetical protein
MVLQRILHVGIREYERRRFAAQFKSDTLEVAAAWISMRSSKPNLYHLPFSSHLLYLLSSEDRPCEADLVDVHVARQGCANFTIASDDIDDTWRKSSLFYQITKLEYANGRLLGSLVYERASGRKSGSGLESKEKTGTVPGSNACTYTNRIVLYDLVYTILFWPLLTRKFVRPARVVSP